MAFLYYLDRTVLSGTPPYHLWVSGKVRPSDVEAFAAWEGLRVVFRAENVVWSARREAFTMGARIYPFQFFKEDPQGPLCRVLRTSGGSVVQRFSAAPGYEWMTASVAAELFEGWRGRQHEEVDRWFIEQLEKRWAALVPEANEAPSRFARDLL